MNSETKAAYRSLAGNFYKTHLPNTPVAELTDLNIIGALLRSASGYRPDYFRRLRNALAFDQSCRGHQHIAEEINRTLNPVSVLDLPRKSKQPRRRRITDEDFATWVKALAERDLTVESAALLLIKMTGARPCELVNITVEGNKIKILGAKHSHGGLRGADRVLEASDKDSKLIRNTIGVFQNKGRTLDAMRMAIREVAMEIFGSKKAPSMYTLRHQFGADLKASGMSRREIAYIMGHQATDSISRYGDKRYGRAEAVKVRPAQGADLSRIRRTHSSYSSRPPRSLRMA
ncbi:TPA: site-specific integrase [Pseudomonas aeruginosa]|nr:site-specific integrase [Pseudomonas aeruginosa]